MSTMATQTAKELPTTPLSARIKRPGGAFATPQGLSPVIAPAFAGLAEGWRIGSLASSALRGSVLCDGPVWTLSANGTPPPCSEFFAVTTTLRPDHILRARFRCGLSGPSLRTGLALFAQDAEAPRAMLLFEKDSAVSPKPQSSVRSYTWQQDLNAPLLRREHNLRPTTISAETGQPLFLRLGISSGAIAAAVSSDGSDWLIMDGGAAPLEPLRAGMVLNSGSRQHPAHMWIDDVALKPSLI